MSVELLKEFYSHERRAQEHFQSQVSRCKRREHRLQQQQRESAAARAASASAARGLYASSAPFGAASQSPRRVAACSSSCSGGGGLGGTASNKHSSSPRNVLIGNTTGVLPLITSNTDTGALRGASPRRKVQLLHRSVSRDRARDNAIPPSPQREIQFKTRKTPYAFDLPNKGIGAFSAEEAREANRMPLNESANNYQSQYVIPLPPSTSGGSARYGQRNANTMFHRKRAISNMYDTVSGSGVPCLNPTTCHIR